YLCLSHSRICSCTHVLSARIYTLSLHDALPICCHSPGISNVGSSTTRPVSSWWLTNCTVAPRLVPPRSDGKTCRSLVASHGVHRDRKSTRLNSSHVSTSYAVFCLKKTKKTTSKC